MIAIVRTFVASIFLSATTICCGQTKTYLTDEERSWNPYKTGQNLVFRSSDGRYDTLEIVHVINSTFPDGFGARSNERLRVVANHRAMDSNRYLELSFLYIYSSWKHDPSGIDFEFFLPGRSFWGRGYAIRELQKYREISIGTPVTVFDDVIAIEDNSRRPINKQDIKIIFWSKSRGYVRFEQYDGTSGELVQIYK
jgi:hypothetical protein